MKTFSKLYEANKTRVLVNDEWYLVTEINNTRTNIKVDGLCGSLQVGNIERFTNKKVTTAEIKQFIAKKLELDDDDKIENYKGYRKAIKFVKEFYDYKSSISLSTNVENTEILFTVSAYNVSNFIKG